jgi:hypothetical protein
VEKDDHTWVICTDDMLDNDEVDEIIRHGELVRKHLAAPPGKEGGL